MKKIFLTIVSMAVCLTVQGENILKKDIPYLDADGNADMEERCKVLVSYPGDGRNLPVLVFFHGGGLKRGERHIPEKLRQPDLVTVGAGYRVYPTVSVAQLLDDSAAAVAWTVAHAGEFGGDPENIYLSGSSGGAYIALMLALDKHYLAKYGIDADKLSGVISMAGQVITHQAAREEKHINRKQPTIDEMAPLYHIRPDAPPILLLAGDTRSDLLCRRQENAYMYAMMKHIGHKDITFYHFDGVSHNNMGIPSYPVTLNWIRDHEKARGQTRK